MRIAVIVPTYNRPDALAAVIEGYIDQTDLNFEVIIADDGSTESTLKVVSYYQKLATLNIKHVWQEDTGFRLAAVRNRAIAATQADYLILTDGDCIPMPTFVAEHRKLAEPGWFLAGSRVLLSPSFTQQLLAKPLFTLPVLVPALKVTLWPKYYWLKASLSKKINRFLPFISLSLPSHLRKLQPSAWKGAKTCNLSLWRSDYVAINGMDEAYEGWGMDDSDLVVRLFHAGIQRKSARFTAPVLHLWHKENDRSSLQKKH